MATPTLKGVTAQIEFDNLIALVRHHRSHCDDEDCGVLLFSLMPVARLLASRLETGEARHKAYAEITDSGLFL